MNLCAAIIPNCRWLVASNSNQAGRHLIHLSNGEKAMQRGPGVSVVMLIIMLTAGGCASQGAFKNLSAGSIGCVPDEIEISELSSSWSLSGRTWVATCKGRRFVCTAATVSGQGGAQTSCTEELQ